MSVNFGKSVPGIRSERTYTPREVLVGPNGAQYLEQGKIISGAVSRDPLNTGDIVTLRPGLLLGEITSGGEYAPSILGTLSANFTATTFAMTVSAATATELSRRIGTSGTFKLTGPPSSAGTVATSSVSYSAVNTTTGVITNITTLPAFISGSLIQPNDGSETPTVILDEHVRVTDVDGNDLDVSGAKLLRAGMIQSAQVINYPSDTSLKTWLKGTLNKLSSTVAGKAPFDFDDNY